jgi:hypothetical protein
MGFVSWMFGKGRRSAKNSNLPRTPEGASARIAKIQSGESDQRVPATQMMKKGGAVKKTSSKMMDMEGRALKRKTADAKGRAMKKTGKTGYGGVMAMPMGMKKGGAAKKMARKGK